MVAIYRLRVARKAQSRDIKTSDIGGGGSRLQQCRPAALAWEACKMSEDWAATANERVQVLVETGGHPMGF